MAQRRFSRRLIAGLIAGYAGLLFLMVSILSGSWFVFERIAQNGTVENEGQPEGLFEDDSDHAGLCQVSACFSLATNVAACAVGMYFSCFAGAAVKKCRWRSVKVEIDLQFAAVLYGISGVFIMIAAANAVRHFYTGYSVVLAWFCFALCIIACVLLAISKRPTIPIIEDAAQRETGTKMLQFRQKERVKEGRVEETLPGEIPEAGTLPYVQQSSPKRQYAANEEIVPLTENQDNVNAANSQEHSKTPS